MKIICKWIFKDGRQLKGKLKDISDISGNELINMVTTLLAQNETVRLIIENGDINDVIQKKNQGEK